MNKEFRDMLEINQQKITGDAIKWFRNLKEKKMFETGDKSSGSEN